MAEVKSGTSKLSWLAVAAVIAVLGLGLYAAALRGRIVDLEARLVEATLRASDATDRVVDAEKSVLRAQSTLAVVAAPDLVPIELVGQPVAPQAAGRALVSHSRGVVLTASGLPQLPRGRIYQLWLLTSQGPLSVGLLQPEESGHVTVIFDAPRDVTTFAEVAVTMEPDGGMPSPTGEKHLVGTPSH